MERFLKVEFGRGKRTGHLLLVEDNEINQQVALEMLQDSGFTVDVASNGKEAVERVSDSGQPSGYDLVLMDLHMPEMGGYAAAVEISKMQRYANLPIVAMTADAMTGVKEKCLEAGMKDMITKPIDPKKMLETIEKWLRIDESQGKPVESKTASSIPPMPGIDIGDGLSRLAGNEKLYHNLLVKFKTSHGTFVTDLTEKLKSGPNEEARRDIHTLKGLSGNLGMVGLHELCKEFEEKLRTKPQENVDELMRPLQGEMKLVMDSLKNNLADFPMGSRSESGGLKSLLNKLENLLRESDPEVARVVDQIGMVKGEEESVTRLRSLTSKYDFDGALGIVSHLKSRII